MHFSEKDRSGRLRGALTDLTSIVGGSEAYLFDLDPDHDRAHLAASTVDAPAVAIDTSHPLPGGLLSDLILRGIRAEIPEVLDPAGGRPIDESLAPLVNTRALIGLPIPDRGRVVGFVLVGMARFRPIDLATQAGVKLALKALGKALYYRREAELFRERTLVLQADSDAWQKRFSLLFDLANDGIAVLDREGRVLEANAAYEALTGYSASELEEMSVQQLRADDEGSRAPDLLGEGTWSIRTREAGEVRVTYRREYLRSSGREFILSVEAPVERTGDAPRAPRAEPEAKPAPEPADKPAPAADFRRFADEIRNHAEALSGALEEDANLAFHVFQILNVADRLARVADGHPDKAEFGRTEIEEALTRAHAPKAKAGPAEAAPTEAAASRPVARPVETDAPAAAKKAAAAKRPTAVPAGSGTVLIVDDEKLMNELAARILSDSGFRVLSAHSGDEAIEIVEAEPEAVDLVVLDLIMPGVSGHDVFARIKELRPDLRVVLTSGFQTEDVPPELLEDENTSFLHKPYQMQELMRHVLESPADLVPEDDD